MASYFGEVLLPVSRAFWDEDDENDSAETNENPSDLSVRWMKEEPARIKSLLVVEKDMLIDFAREYLCPDSDEVCIVENEKQKKVAVFYQVNSEVYLCTILPNFDVKFSGRFVNKISNILSSAETIISITCQHITYYQSDDVPTTPCFLRTLSTKSGTNLCKLQEKPLEQPNIIFGVAAGVLSYAEFMEQPSILYILYTDTFALDSTSAEPLIKLFAALNCTPHDVTFAGKSFFNKGNLYM